jgi:hypothetical protein
MDFIGKFLKAHVAALTAGVSVIAADGGNVANLTANQWWGVIVAVLAGFGLVAAVPNSGNAAPAVTALDKAASL